MYLSKWTINIFNWAFSYNNNSFLYCMIIYNFILCLKWNNRTRRDSHFSHWDLLVFILVIPAQPLDYCRQWLVTYISKSWKWPLAGAIRSKRRMWENYSTLRRINIFSNFYWIKIQRPGSFTLLYQLGYRHLLPIYK